MLNIRIKRNIEWKTFFDEASENWVGICEPLKMTISGESHEDLVDSINDTLKLIFQDIVEFGNFDEFLQLHGWQKIDLSGSEDRDTIDVPWTMTEATEFDTQKPVCC